MTEGQSQVRAEVYFLGIVFVHLIGASMLSSKNTLRGMLLRRIFLGVQAGGAQKNQQRRLVHSCEL